MQEKPSCSAVQPRPALGAFLLLWLEAVCQASFICGLILYNEERGLKMWTCSMRVSRKQTEL